MPPPRGFKVRGFTDLQRALKNADRDVRLGVKREMRDAAEPVKRDAETLTATRIRRMSRSPQWSRMRVGVTQRVVYVAPKQRGLGRGDHPAKRPKLSGLMLTRAMEPALRQNESQIRRDFEQMLNDMARRFNRS